MYVVKIVKYYLINESGKKCLFMSITHRACQFQIVAKTDRHAIAVELVSAKTGISSNYVTTF